MNASRAVVLFAPIIISYAVQGVALVYFILVGQERSLDALVGRWINLRVYARGPA